MQNRRLISLCAAAGLVLLGLVCLSMFMAHFHQASDSSLRLLSVPQAGQRSGERMAFPWPEGTVNPNAADAQALEALPGIGPAIAQSIIDERTANGPFFYPEDLLTVKGIGAKLLQKLWEHLSLPLPTYQ